MSIFQGTKGLRGFSLVEVLVSLAILLAGILTIINLYPLSLKANRRAIDISKAVVLAQLKAEEVRRDAGGVNLFLSNIKALTTPTEPRVFPEEPYLTYSFCGKSLIDPIDDPDDPRDDIGVARVIIRYNRAFRPSEDVLYELRFAE